MSRYTPLRVAFFLLNHLLASRTTSFCLDIITQWPTIPDKTNRECGPPRPGLRTGLHMAQRLEIASNLAAAKLQRIRALGMELNPLRRS